MEGEYARQQQNGGESSRDTSKQRNGLEMHSNLSIKMNTNAGI